MEFTPNSFYYTVSGAKVYYRFCIDNTHYVSSVYEVYDGDECYEEISNEIISVDQNKLYNDPPKKVYDSYVNEARDKQFKINQDILQLYKQKRELEQSIAKHTEQLNQLKSKYPDFQTAVDFIEGNINHLLVYSTFSAAEIVPFIEYSESESAFENGLKLFCLFGCKDKTKWMINKYSDGSGGWKTIVPFRKQQDAKDYLQKLVYTESEKVLQDHKYRTIFCIHDTYKKNPWLDISEEWKKYSKEVKRASINKNLEAYQEKINQLQKELTML